MNAIKNPRGAGRKPSVSNDGGKKVTVYLDAETVAKAKALGDGNVSLGIRRAVTSVTTPDS